MVVPVYYERNVPLVRTLATNAERLGVEFLAFCNSEAAQIEAQRTGIRIASSFKNIGYGRAANFVAAGRAFDWLILCNDDLEVTRSDFGSFVRIAKSLPPSDPWAIGLLDGSQRRLYHIPGVLGVLSNVSLLRALKDRLRPEAMRSSNTNQQGADSILTEIGPRTAFPFVCVGISAASWRAVGGFDPEFPLYFEDTDFVARASRVEGHRFGVVWAPIKHYHSSSTRQDLRRTLPVFAWSAYLYMTRHTILGPRSARAALCTGLLVRLFLAALAKGSAREQLWGTVVAFGAILSGRKPELPPWKP